MRLEKYTKLLEYDGRGFVYAQVFSRLFEIPYKSYLLLKDRKFDELRSQYPVVFNTLIEGKILVDDNFDDLQELDNAVRNYNLTGDSSAIGLTIAPTLSCNFRCIYCYEESAGHQPFLCQKRQPIML